MVQCCALRQCDTQVDITALTMDQLLDAEAAEHSMMTSMGTIPGSKPQLRQHMLSKRGPGASPSGHSAAGFVSDACALRCLLRAAGGYFGDDVVLLGLPCSARNVVLRVDVSVCR